MTFKQLSGIALAAFVLATVLPCPAVASGGVWCEGQIDGEKFDINISTGRSHILAVLNAQISIGSKEWATQPANGETEVVFGQGMIEGTRFAVDFVDPNFEVILFGLRVDFSGAGEREDDRPFEGKMTLNEKRSFPVYCQGDA